MNSTLPASGLSSSAPGNRAWRWLAAAATTANVFLNYWSNAHPFNGQTNAVVSGKYPTPVTPAGYAFSIWGLIFLSLLAYAVWQLLPAQRPNPLPDRLARPLVLVNVLTGCWLVIFAYELLPLSALVMIGILAALALAYGRLRQLARLEPATVPAWVNLPFGLYLGWISVALVVNLTVALGQHWQPGPAPGLVLAMGLMGVVAALALGVVGRFRELAYPAAVTWGLVGIWAARNGAPDTQFLAWAALLAAAVVALGALVLVWRGRRGEAVKG
ncbi:tryptophan-rich sensory protein [Hymenobacter rubripertinctus]|uniref:Tryptophan-rich sensory protein n=1 Tax=Hymenobacter rubripertinctus TaxID=2029981 RepID=A0A418QYK6_9BACT|nr:tryptophan-rich sensory protein [Hymenobacter rubripertinctus]RIY10229.1 tryptophan-rich sensory protein [Hymenobacter rubripertinctus]